MTNLAASGARGGFVTLAGQGLIFVCRTLGVILLARLLAPDIFGVVAIVTAITTFISGIVLFGLPMAEAQASQLGQRAKTSLFVVNTVVGIALGLGLFLAAPAIASLYGNPNLIAIARWMALVPIFNGLEVQFRIHLMRALRFSGIAIAQVSATVVALVAAICLAMTGFSYLAIVAQVVIQPLLQFVIVMLIARWIPTIPGDWRNEVVPIMGVAVRIFAMNVLRNASRSVIVPALGLNATASAVGSFDRAQQFSVSPINLTVVQMQRVAVPVLSRLRDEPDRMLAYMRRAQLVAAYLTGTAFFVMAALALPLVTTLLGRNWILAGAILQILSLGAVFRVLGQSMQWLFISANATSSGLRFNLWAQPAVAALSLVGLPWGVLGVAIANAFAWALYWPLSTYFAAKAAHFSAKPLLNDVLRAIIFFGLPSGVAAYVGTTFASNPVMQIGIGLGFALVVAIASIAAFRPVRQDLSSVYEVIKLALRRPRGRVESV